MRFKTATRSPGSSPEHESDDEFDSAAFWKKHWEDPADEHDEARMSKLAEEYEPDDEEYIPDGTRPPNSMVPRPSDEQLAEWSMRIQAGIAESEKLPDLRDQGVIDASVAARKALVESILPRIHQICWGYAKKYNSDQNALVGLGCLGAMEAAAKYKSELGRFITYAESYVRKPFREIEKRYYDMLDGKITGDLAERTTKKSTERVRTEFAVCMDRQRHPCTYIVLWLGDRGFEVTERQVRYWRDGTYKPRPEIRLRLEALYDDVKYGDLFEASEREDSRRHGIELQRDLSSAPEGQSESQDQGLSCEDEAELKGGEVEYSEERIYGDSFED